MTGIDLPCERIDEIVIDKHFVPRANKIDIDVVGDLQVPVHSEEALERAVDRIVERDSVETVEPCISQEVLVVTGCQIRGSKVTGRELGGSSTSAAAKI